MNACPRSLGRALVILVLGASTACAGGGPAAGGGLDAEAASDAVWRSLATARVTPEDGALRVALGEMDVPEGALSPEGSAVRSELGFSELVAAGLLRRADVHFVERRRFTAAVDAERQGRARPEGAPPIGTSPGAEWIMEGGLADFGGMATTLELRLVDARSGAIRHSWRVEARGEAEMVGLARAVVGSLVEELGSLGRRPAWSDPEPALAPTSFEDSSVSADALSDFLRGLEAEERWDWDAAREGYQAALRSAPTFVEARVALARTARLRLGGTLGASRP